MRLLKIVEAMKLLIKALGLLLFAVSFGQSAKAQPSDDSSILIVNQNSGREKITLDLWQVYIGEYRNSTETLPIAWQKVPYIGSIEELKSPLYGIVTYRRLIQFPEAGQWEIFIPEPIGTIIVWIDGKRMFSHARISTDIHKNKMIRGNSLYNFDVGTEPVEIAIEIANWENPNGGGFMAAPILAKAPILQRHKQLLMGLDQFMLGALFIMGFYHFALHILRPNGLMNLVFGAYCLAVGLRSMFAGDGRYWNLLFPEFDGIWSWKIELQCLYICTPLIQYFIRDLFPKEYKHWVPNLISIVSIPFFFATLVFDLNLGWKILPFYQLILLFAACYSLSAVLLAFFRKRESSGTFLLAGVLLFIAVVNDVLESMGTIESEKLITFGLLAFIFSNSFLISRRFSKAFTRVEETEREIRVLNESLEQKVDEQTRDIKSILQHIQQGVLTITSAQDYQIGHDYSPFLTQLLGESDLAGKNALDIIFKNASITADSLSRIRTVLDFSIGEMQWSWEGNLDNLTHSFEKQGAEGELQYFDIDWNPVIHDGIIIKILVTIRDVSSIKALERESRRKELDLQYISEIVNIPPQKFDDLVQQALGYICENRRLLNASTTYNSESLKIMFINYHTLKGVCRSYNMTLLASMIHESEQALAYLQKNPSAVWDQQALMKDLSRVESMVQTYIDLSTEKLGRTLNTDQQVVVDRQLFEERIEELQKIDLNHLSKEEIDIIEKTMKAFQNSFFFSSHEIFTEIFEPIEKLARDLGKDEPVIDFKDQGLTLDRNQQKLFKNVFLHIIRNSLDHGIETAEERIKAGKPPAGTITIELKQEDDHIIIQYYDDGRGLNLQRLRNIAKERNLLDEDELDDDSKVANLIFTSGLSTANTTTQVSGRGVGMGAVRQFLEDSRGQIIIQFTEEQERAGFRKFAFSIHLPKRISKVA
ncbi:MAG: 7TM diverse intracellular signaling domain-containing protein [Oligoflexus sp.]